MEVIYYHKDYDAYKQGDIVAWARAYNLDYIVELHRNAGGGTGYETLVKGSYDNTDLAIHNAMVSLGWANRGIKYRDNLANMNRISGVCSYSLIELGFIDNMNDNTIFDKNRANIGYKIYSACESTGVRRLGVICGHGQGDPGACSGGRTEAADVRNIYVAKGSVTPAPTPAPPVQKADAMPNASGIVNLAPGRYLFISAENGKALAGRNNEEACIWQVHGLADQFWDWDGVRLMNVKHQKALTLAAAAVKGKGLLNYDVCTVWNYVNVDHQKVYFYKGNNGGLYIMFKHSNKALDVLDHKTTNGSRVGQYSAHGKPNQMWIPIRLG